MNTVNLIGRLTADPEIKYFESGSVTTRFSIAINTGYGEKEEVSYFEVQTWKKTAENVAAYCRKGSLVGISGSLKQERWTDKQTNQNRSKVLVLAMRVEFLSPKTVSDSKSSASPPPPPQAKVATGPDYDEIPF